MTENTQLVDIQTTLAHLEITVEALNKVVSQQDQQIQDLQRQLQLMYSYLQNNSETGVAPFELLADRPPHY